MAKYGAAVQNPEILAQLQGGAGRYGAAVTDPVVLAQLSGNGSATDELMQKAGIAGKQPVADSLFGKWNNTVNTLSGSLKNPAQRQQFEDQVAKQIRGSTMAMMPEFGAIGEAGAPGFGGQVGAQLGQASAPFARLPWAASGPLNMAARAIKNMVASGMTNVGMSGSGTPQEKFKQGLMEAAGPAILGEAITAPFRAVAGTAELMHPQALADSMVNSIKQNYRTARDITRNIYGQLENLYGYRPVKNAPILPFRDINPDAYRLFSPDVRRLQDRYDASPTYLNGHKLQSQMFSESSGLEGSKDVATRDRIAAYTQARRGIHNELSNFLQQQNPAANDAYQFARGVTRDFLGPHMQNETINKLVSSNVRSVKPHELNAGLKDLTEQGSQRFPTVPQGHYLRELQELLENKMHTAALAKWGIPAAAGGVGSIAGSAQYGPMGATVGPLAFGISAAIPAVAQNPILVRALQEINRVGQTVKRGIIGTS